MVKVVMAGGGTAGHVNPLLATAAQLRESGAEVVVLGTKAGLEADLVPAAGFPLVEIPRVPLPRRPSLAFFTLPSRFSDAVKRCAQALEGADVLVGFGGYVSTPAYIAAKRAGVPIVIHEQNARPGLANKVGARNAAVVALTFPSSPLAARSGQTVVTGLPLRSAVADLAERRASAEGAGAARREAAERLGVNPDAPTLLVTGGSLGALHVNESMTGGADALPEGAQVIHLTGRGKDEPVRKAVEAAGLSDRWHVIDYLTTMEDALAVADLVVCRSGAGTVAEMEALGLHLRAAADRQRRAAPERGRSRRRRGRPAHRRQGLYRRVRAPQRVPVAGVDPSGGHGGCVAVAGARGCCSRAGRSGAGAGEGGRP